MQGVGSFIMYINLDLETEEIKGKKINKINEKIDKKQVYC